MWIAILLGLLLLVLVLPFQGIRKKEERPPATASICPAPEGVMDVGPDGGIGRRPPPRPAPNQRLAPCGKKGTEIYGGCYYRADPSLFSPPCEAPTFEHEGRCYFMAFATEKPDTSISE